MRILFLAASAVILSACSSIFHGTNQNVDCTSDPEGAEVFHKEELMGKTPCVVTLDRDEATFLVFRHDGYPGQDITVQLTPEFNGATFGNILFGGFIGAAVDAGTGANYTLSPDPAHAQFAPLPENEEVGID